MTHQTMDTCKAVYLTAEDLRVAASLLYNAYHDDPFLMDALYHSDTAKYEQRLRGAIREALNELWQQEQTLIGLFSEERLIGVACIVNQDIALGEARYWHWRFKMLLSAGWQSTQAWINKEDLVVKGLPSAQCSIIQFIAVSANEQNKGYGSQLIKATLSWCDEQPMLDGVGVFVCDPQHVGLFSQHGFDKLENIVIGSTVGELMFYQGQKHE